MNFEFLLLTRKRECYDVTTSQYWVSAGNKHLSWQTFASLYPQTASITKSPRSFWNEMPTVWWFLRNFLTRTPFPWCQGNANHLYNIFRSKPKADNLRSRTSPCPETKGSRNQLLYSLPPPPTTAAQSILSFIKYGATIILLNFLWASNLGAFFPSIFLIKTRLLANTICY